MKVTPCSLLTDGGLPLLRTSPAGQRSTFRRSWQASHLTCPGSVMLSPGRELLPFVGAGTAGSYFTWLRTAEYTEFPLHGFPSWIWASPLHCFRSIRKLA